MDLFIYKSDSFYLDGKLSISIHQKETNKFMYIPFRSFHQRHTIKNFVWGELKRYVRYNTEEKNFKKLRTRFFLCLRNCGFKKYVLSKLFRHVTYSQTVNHLLFRKQREGFCWKEKKLSAFRKETRKRRIPKTQSAPEPST